MRKDLALVALLMLTLALMAVPVSTTLIDFLLAANISLSIILLMVAIYLRRPSDFSTFPSVLLIGTAFRLALSIGTTRLILSEADAGTIIETFGEFVVAGSVAIGLVIFLIITVVQFLVITKGAERVAEVGARFALDALPGKQMSIDAEVRAGNMTSDEAAMQRALLDKESQFFGAMDGAMKFVKGDAIAGLIIICINLVGGISIGMMLHGYSFAESASIFSLLTVGDGLVAQLPALLMSLCAGIMVTRVSNSQSEDLGTDITREILSDLRVPTVASGLILAFGFVPGFPTLIFGSVAFALFFGAVITRRRTKDGATGDENVQTDVSDSSKSAAEMDAENASKLEYTDRFAIFLASETANTVDIDALESLNLKYFWDLFAQRGVRFPRAKILEEQHPQPGLRVEFLLDEVPLSAIELVAGNALLGTADLSAYLAEFPDHAPTEFKSRDLSGYWIPVNHVQTMKALNVNIWSHEEIIATIAFRLYERNIGTLFSNEALSKLLQHLRLIDGESMTQIESEMNHANMLRMFRFLIEDGVPLRPASLVVSSLHYWIYNSENPSPMKLAELLRSSMKRQLCYSIANSTGVMGLALLHPDLEANIRRGIGDLRKMPQGQATDAAIGLEAEPTDALLDQVRTMQEDHKEGAYQLTIVATGDIRRRIRNFLAANDVHLPVLAPHEMVPEVPSFPVDMVSLDTKDQPAAERPRQNQASKLERA